MYYLPYLLYTWWIDGVSLKNCIHIINFICFFLTHVTSSNVLFSALKLLQNITNQFNIWSFSYLCPELICNLIRLTVIVLFICRTENIWSSDDTQWFACAGIAQSQWQNELRWWVEHVRSSQSMHIQPSWCLREGFYGTQVEGTSKNMCHIVREQPNSRLHGRNIFWEFGHFPRKISFPVNSGIFHNWIFFEFVKVLFSFVAYLINFKQVKLKHFTRFTTCICTNSL